MFQYLGMDRTIVSMHSVARSGGVILPKVLVRKVRSAKIEDNNIQHILKWNIVKNDRRNKMVVEDVIREAEAGHFCIVVSDRRNHCERLHELIQQRWRKSGIATGKYSKKYIQEQVDAFNNNDITVLTTTFSLLGEGFDVPFLDRAFVSMPFRAEAKAEQLIGRIQRFYPGKQDAIVYDYVDVDIGVLENQFSNSRKDSRSRAYKRLGIPIIE